MHLRIIPALLLASPVYAANALLASSAAIAAPVNFTQALPDLHSKPLTECKENSSDGKSCARTGPITLGEVAAGSLMVPDRNATIEQQIKRARLAQETIDGKSVDLTAEEVQMIKEHVVKLGAQPVILYDVVKIIDPAALK